MSDHPSLSTLSSALVEFQARVRPVQRSRTVSVTTKSGGRYEFAYAPLEAIIASVKDELAACRLAVVQALTHTDDGGMALRTTLIHESGEREEDETPLPIRPGMSPQEIGSVITYFRRYAYSALLGLATEEDDDGNLASGNEAKPAPLTAELRKKAEDLAAAYGLDFDAVARDLGFDVASMTVDDARVVVKELARMSSK